MGRANYLFNKKVKNAKAVTIDGIDFLSEFEAKCYLILKASGLKFEYESEKITIIEGFKDENVKQFKFRSLKKVSKMKKPKPLFEVKPMYAERPTTYTPDFIIYTPTRKVYVECKGFKTDTFSMKQKLFLKKLSEMAKTSNLSIEYALVQSLSEINSVVKSLKENLL